MEQATTEKTSSAVSTQTTTTVGVPPQQELFNVPLVGYGGGVLGSLLTFIGSVMWFRRKISRDNLEIARDVSEKKLLTVITEERDRAVLAAEQAWRTRTDDARLIGELTGEVKHLTDANAHLIKDVGSLRDEIAQLRDIIHSMLPPEIATQMRQNAIQRAADLREIIPLPPHE